MPSDLRKEFYAEELSEETQMEEQETTEQVEETVPQEETTEPAEESNEQQMEEPENNPPEEIVEETKPHVTVEHYDVPSEKPEIFKSFKCFFKFIFTGTC